MLTIYMLTIVLWPTLITCYSQFRVVDLTHTHGHKTLFWPGFPKYNFTIYNRGSQDKAGLEWYEDNYFATAEHGGTHLDAPSHFAEGMWRAHQIPMERLVGPGVVINVKNEAKKDNDYRVALEDLERWETKYGRIPNGAIVLMNSGWDQRYPNANQVFGTDNIKDTSSFHFPGFSKEAADWLIRYRNVHVIGVDTPSNDAGQVTNSPVHIILGKGNVPGVENVANLDRIPENGAMVFVASIKLYDGSGGPARVFATFYEKDDTASQTCKG